MIRGAFICIAFALTAAGASAQSALPEGENGRFSFNQVAEGMLRLDMRTGQVSLCSRRQAGWACQVVPDERAVLESEIGRLQSENGALKKEMIARGVPLPGPMTGAPPKVRPEVELKLPSDAELDRVMAFMEKAWRRLLHMVEEMQREREKKG